jgi:hypothetical protein
MPTQSELRLPQTTVVSCRFKPQSVEVLILSLCVRINEQRLEYRRDTASQMGFTDLG